MTLEFELSISTAEPPPTGSNVTVRYSKGISAQMRMGTFSLAAVVEVVDGIGDALLAHEPQREFMEQAGAALFDALFAGQVLDAWRECRTLAASQGTDVRLRLYTDQPELMAVPWEYLYDSQNGRWLALDTDLSLVRGLPLSGREPLALDGMLRVLVMIAAPTDLDTLDSEQEWANLDEATATAAVELIRIEPNYTALQSALRQHQPHAFHFVGHGTVSEQGALLFCAEDGSADEIGGNRLVPLLAGSASLQLIFLNACEGSAPGSASAFAGLAQQLIQQQIPAVLAMQAPIYDDHALGFSREFYAGLADGVSVEKAVHEGRLAVHRLAYSWGIPTFYFQSGEPFVLPPLSPAEKAERLWQKAQSVSEPARRRTLLKQIAQHNPQHPGAVRALAQLAGEEEAAPLYAAAEEYVRNEQWRDAHQRLAKIEQLAPNFRQTRSLLAQVLGRLAGAPPPTVDFDAQYEQYRPILSALQEGRLVPFLGWNVGRVGRPAGDAWVQGQYLPDMAEAAQELTRHLAGAVDGIFSLPQVSQYTSLLDGESALYDRLVELYSGDYQPTLLHKLLAEVPRRLARKGYPADASRRFVIFSVAFDDLLEQAFAEAGQPCHLFVYRNRFEDDNGVGRPGHFLHIKPDGSSQEVLSPNNYAGLGDDSLPVIVKLSGQAVSAEPDSVMVTEDQYLAYLSGQGGFHSLLPTTLLAKLKKSSFLFFGYSLRPWHLRLLWQRMSNQGRHRQNRSWAIVDREDAIEREFWRSQEIVPIVAAVEGVVAYVNDWLDRLEAR